MCDKCKNSRVPYLDTIIYKDDSTVAARLCPNCMTETVYDKEFPRCRGIYTSELSGSHGALKIVEAAESDNPNTYFLLDEEAERLFRHELSPEEFFILDKKHHGEFLLDEDFYDQETGEAIQPMGDR